MIILPSESLSKPHGIVVKNERSGICEVPSIQQIPDYVHSSSVFFPSQNFQKLNIRADIQHVMKDLPFIRDFYKP